MEVAKTTRPTHICTSCWQTGGAGTYCSCRGDGNEAGEVVSFEDLGTALREGQQFESDYWQAEQRAEALQKQLDEMASTLAIIVRWGTGANLQASHARGMLERHGYTIDRKGWLDTEPGYDPTAPPWKEDRHA